MKILRNTKNSLSHLLAMLEVKLKKKKIHLLAAGRQSIEGLYQLF